LKVNQEVIKAVRPGILEEDLWEVCAKVLGKKIENMPHSLGHGVGLEVHEFPRLYKDCKRKLEQGMIITIEPGLYYPDWGGVRIEDYVLVTEGGYQVLSVTAK
jgi:Xaa-Pro aminopeptidase